MSVVQAILTDPNLPLEVRQEALNRANADPGIPHSSGATKSFWLNQRSLDATSKSSSLPEDVDIVIIGSGISGASVAKAVLEINDDQTGSAVNTSKPTVMMIDARDLCSGATGRNGGHILETGEDFVDLESEYGLEAARSIMRFRLSHLAEIMAMANSFGITTQCQARKVEFVLACFDHERWRETVKRIRRLKEALPEETRAWNLIGKSNAKEYGIPHARGLVTGPAGAIWPYRFVTAVLEHLVAQHSDRFVLETNTPVTAVTTTVDNARKRQSTVHTTRGMIRARHIIHCTNAHVGHLVPGLRGIIFPVRGQMSAQTPSPRFPHQGDDRSWIFAYEKGFDYLTQLPMDERSSGEMMLGGGFVQSEGCGVDDVGISSDDRISRCVDIHLSRTLGDVFGSQYWGSVDQKAVKQTWTGTMGFSADVLPWVGKIPERATGRETVTMNGGIEQQGAEWVAAGFSGEGMVQAWLCGKALVSMLLEHEGSEQRPSGPAWFPRQMILTEERMSKAQLPKQAVS